VILGTGGSSLGGQTLTQLAGHAVPGIGALRPGLRLHFMDNLDPESYGALLKHLPLATSRFVAISKSGSTGETLNADRCCTGSRARRRALGTHPGSFFLASRNPQKAASARGCACCATNTASQCSTTIPASAAAIPCFTNVGLLPAAALGLDVAAIRAGAANALAPVLLGHPPADITCRGRRRAVRCELANRSPS